ncbi:hypothetical protein [Streptomyces phaeoluteigriseus]|uniref:hypothetical protein n=1 Tax=Streptomyces phaeoluteigriseus TaxID=114686 RepID=UPI003692D4A9
MGRDWHGAPAKAAFVHGSADHAEVVGTTLVEAVLNHLNEGASPHSWRGFGGFRDQVTGGARRGRAGALAQTAETASTTARSP